MFNALNIVDSLFNTNNYLLFDFPGASAGVGHIDVDKIDWYCRKHFLTNTRCRHSATGQNQNHHQIGGNRVAYKPGDQAIQEASPADCCVCWGSWFS